MTDCMEEDDFEIPNTSRSLPVEKQWKFKDGERTIDFVLVWEKSEVVNSHDWSENCSENCLEKRKLFEQNLIEEGLEIEYDTSDDGIVNFVKLHAPLEVLRRYSEILKLRMPMKEELCTINKKNKMNPILQATTFITQKIPVLDRKTSFMDSACNFWSNFFKHNVYVDQNLFPNEKLRFTAVYSRDKEYLFDLYSPGFFTPAIRSRIVQFILDRTSFAESSSQDDISSKEKVFFNFGIERLIASEVYIAAYPLHDGDLRTPGSMRYLLLTEWASVNKWYRYQPVDHIRGYFGVKIGLYFAWLGFYTHMLFPAAVVGIACFICSWFTLKYYKPSQDICSNETNIKMCPLCDVFCDFWDLQETCFHSKVAFLFDNYTTVFFAVFMSFWATMFLEMWKRYSAEITHRWDLTGFDAQEESPRPQYLVRLALLDKANLAQYKLNVITNSIEPQVPFWRIRFPATIFSFSIVLLLVALALAAVLGVVLYRMSVLAALSVYGDSVITSYAILFTTATAATINLICIFIFNWIYAWLSQYLTELEMNRTQSEYDDSLTLKMYLLQFVNYYASIFYIAFCKGKLVGFPAKYNRLFGFRQEECGPGGCLMELCIQLAIIMVGKQAFNTCLEMVFPLFTKWWKSRGIKRRSKRGKGEQWEKDYKLVEWGAQALFPEYLEMVLQYGFVTIFVAAFPLAPVFALINNILEMRLDAKKLLTFHRRPVSQRVKDIGVWFRILDTISKLAVITNGFIIAFTSDFVPRLVYTVMISSEHSLNGYLNDSLSFMDIQDLDVMKPMNSTLKYCRYPDYREPPWAHNKYNKTTMYWNVLAARLAFVVIFENVVVMVVLLVQWCVPDVPAKLKEQIRREAYITNEIIISQEAKAATQMRMKQSMKSLGQVTEQNTSLDPTEIPNCSSSVDQICLNLSKYNKEEIKDAVLVNIHKAKSYGEINEVTV